MRTAAFARHKERCGLCANPRTVAAFSGSDSINQGRDEGISNLIQNLHPFVFRFASGDPNAPNSRSKVQGSKFTGNGFQPFNRCAWFKPFKPWKVGERQTNSRCSRSNEGSYFTSLALFFLKRLNFRWLGMFRSRATALLFLPARC